MRWIVVVVVVCSACGGKLTDCQELVDKQSVCMPQSAIDDCEEANDECRDGGEVLTLESCPLQFTCSKPT